MKNPFTHFIPSPLKSIENKLMPSVLPYSSMQFSEQVHSPVQSKIAGRPFLPISMKPPLTEDGDGMFLLIQINFAEAHIPFPFPAKGLLQLFIDPIVLNNYSIDCIIIPKNLYEIRYYNEPFNLSINLFEIQNIASTSAIRQERGIRFNCHYEPVSLTDYRLPKFVTNKDIRSFEVQTASPFEEVYAQHFLSAENKVGGYPYFLEQDIRLTDESLYLYDALLFQIVSNEDDNIMIGNCGVIKVFINKYDLMRKDFSDVLLFVEDYT